MAYGAVVESQKVEKPRKRIVVLTAVLAASALGAVALLRDGPSPDPSVKILHSNDAAPEPGTAVLVDQEKGRRDRQEERQEARQARQEERQNEHDCKYVEYHIGDAVGYVEGGGTDFGKFLTDSESVPGVPEDFMTNAWSTCYKTADELGASLLLGFSCERCVGGRTFRA
eukprot:SAG11_NODE_5267_length_1610_cov_23.999338_1_plen_170_part_00